MKRQVPNEHNFATAGSRKPRTVPYLRNGQPELDAERYGQFPVFKENQQNQLACVAPLASCLPSSKLTKSQTMTQSRFSLQASATMARFESR